MGSDVLGFGAFTRGTRVVGGVEGPCHTVAELAAYFAGLVAEGRGGYPVLIPEADGWAGFAAGLVTDDAGMVAVTLDVTAGF